MIFFTNLGTRYIRRQNLEKMNNQH